MSKTTISDAVDFIGRDQWHCSEEGGGPDVGHMLTIAENKHLWAGEITKQRWEDAGVDAAELGDDFGFWLILYDGEEVTVLGKFLSPETGRTLIEEIAAAITTHKDNLVALRGTRCPSCAGGQVLVGQPPVTRPLKS